MRTSTLLLLLFSFLLSLPAIAQWEWQNPLPQGQNLHSIEFINENEGWAGGENATILHTDDSGETWEYQYNNEGSIFYDIEFITDQVGFAAGGYPFIERKILKTTNGGDDWVVVLDSVGSRMYPVYDLFNLENDTLIAVGAYGTFLKSEDGGINWQLVNTGFDFHFKSCWFFNSENGLIVGPEGSIIRKNNNSGWVELDPFTNLDFYSVYFLDAHQGFICGEAGAVYRTIDGGNSWSLLPKLTNQVLYHIDFVGHNYGWIAGGIGLFTSDAGNTWTVQQVTGSAASHPTESTGFTTQAYGDIFRTVDYGEQWTEMSSGYHDLIYDIYFLDELHGWAIEDHLPDRHVLYTDDGGNNWSIISTIHEPLWAFCFADEMNGWVVSTHYIHHTSNGGYDWEIQKYADGWGSTYLSDVFFTDRYHGWVVSHFDTIYRTVDGGEIWQAIPIDSYGLEECFFIDQDTGWAVGYISNILKTTDGGLTWIDISPPDRFTDYESVYFTDSKNGWVVGRGNLILHTQDGGESWDSQSESYERDLYAVTFVDSLNGWISGSYGSILHTSDGGVNWDKQQSNCWNHLFHICFTDLNNGWAAGFFGNIIHTSTGGTVGIKEVPFISSSTNALNYPNPLKNSTSIEYELSSRELVKINIFDNLGNEVETLLFEWQEPGKHRVTWDAGKNSPGIYYFYIQTGQNRFSGKMLVVR